MIDLKSEEYFRIYQPQAYANNCCIICKKNIDGCSWSRSLTPVKGWKAEKGEKRGDEPHEPYKIYYCPEFEEGDSSEGREYDEEKCMELLEAVYKSAADDYRSAYKRKLKYTSMDAEFWKAEIQMAEQKMRECTFLLGKHTERLKRIVEQELAEGKADG